MNRGALNLIIGQPSTDEKPLRVVLVGPSLAYIGGQAVQAQTLMRLWRGESTVYMRFVPVDPEPPRVLRWTVRIRYVRTLVRGITYLLNLMREVPEADIVHVFSASYWSFVLAPTPAVLIGRLFGKKILLNYRSGEADEHFRRWSRFVRWVLRRADRVVVGSEFLCRIFLQLRIQADVIPNVIDQEQFCFRLRRSLTPRLLCTRGFEAHYGIPDVLKAFAKVKTKLPNATLTLVGKGPQEPLLRKLAADLQLPNITFAGAVSHDEIAEWYDRHEILINASKIDNMPVSILEAFAAGLPVVSTDAGGIPFLVEHERTGLLSPVSKPDELAANVIRILENPELARALSLQGWLESARYCWSEVGPQWLRVYRDLLTKSSQTTWMSGAAPIQRSRKTGVGTE